MPDYDRLKIEKIVSKSCIGRVTMCHHFELNIEKDMKCISKLNNVPTSTLL